MQKWIRPDYSLLQAAWCCRAPGMAPTAPDVKTIQHTREFPYLLSDSECRLPPAPLLPPALCLSVCLSLLLFSLPLALIPPMES